MNDLTRRRPISPLDTPRDDPRQADRGPAARRVPGGERRATDREPALEPAAVQILLHPAALDAAIAAHDADPAWHRSLTPHEAARRRARMARALAAFHLALGGV